MKVIKFCVAVFLLASFVKGTHSEVNLRFLDLNPGFESNNSVLINSNVTVGLNCSGSYPVELICNGADYIFDQDKYFTQVERNAMTAGGYNYSAILLARNGWLMDDVNFMCRAVANHSDNILLTLQPRYIDKRRLIIVQLEKQVLLTEEYNGGPEWPCKIKFTVARGLDNYHWKCTSDLYEGEGRVYITNDDCKTASGCANTHRRNKASAGCVVEVENIGLVKDTQTCKSAAADLEAGAGLAVCTFLEFGETSIERAVEFFYEVNSTEGQPLQKNIRFSLPDTQMQNLIWMEPAPRSSTPYYTREVFDTNCCIPFYGFAKYGEIIVTHNGSILAGSGIGGHFNETNIAYSPKKKVLDYYKKSINIDFRTFGPGFYIIQCIAPVWNTTEWANHNRTLEVRDQVPMSFTSGSTQRLVLTDGERNRPLSCDVTGDPGPTAINWEPHPRPPGTYANGTVLHIQTVTSSLSNLITCTATNQFGDRITKEFYVDVNEPIPVVPITVSGAAAVVLVFIFVPIIIWRRSKRAEDLLTDEQVREFLEGSASIPDAEPGYQHPLLPLVNRSSVVSVQENSAGQNLGAEDENDGIEDPICAEDIQLNSRFEIKKKNFIVDFKSKLGEGAYGFVCKGFIKLNEHDRNPTPVAVKQVDSHLNKATRTFYLKALMSELKILAYIGQHPNIAKLVGAYWENIRQGTLYVGVEFCKISLLQFLRDNRKLIVSSSGNAIPLRRTRTSSQDSGSIAIMDMIRWASEIAAGMEFLARKRVVHADLAARNVLLTFDLNAKVCDFGLARQLINTVYVKQTNTYLPWQWMAIESLRHREFSTRSDVWSFGVTLWEIFTLGIHWALGTGHWAYPTAEWTQDEAFLDKLVDGMRLPKPEFASDEMYGVMRECWQEDPMDRPKFGDLKRLFNAQLTPEDVDANDNTL